MLLAKACRQPSHARARILRTRAALACYMGHVASSLSLSSSWDMLRATCSRCRPLSLCLYFLRCTLSTERRSHDGRALVPPMARQVAAVSVESADQTGARPVAHDHSAARPNTSGSPRRGYSGVLGRGGVARAAPSINRGGPPVRHQPMGRWAVRAAAAASVTRCHAYLPCLLRSVSPVCLCIALSLHLSAYIVLASDFIARAASDACRGSQWRGRGGE